MKAFTVLMLLVGIGFNLAAINKEPDKARRLHQDLLLTDRLLDISNKEISRLNTIIVECQEEKLEPRALILPE